MKNQTTQFQQHFVPVRFVIKYQPPIIGLVYKRNQTDQQMRIYEIHLNNLVFVPNAEEVAKQLFMEHSLWLNNKLISINQVKKLVEKIQEKIFKDVKRDNDDLDQAAEFQQEDDDLDFLTQGTKDKPSDKNAYQFSNDFNTSSEKKAQDLLEQNNDQDLI